MHAALGFLLILTVHRCYPAGVPRCLQRNLIRRQIRNYSKTLCFIWILAILINIPLFFLTKYEKHPLNQIENQTNITKFISTCDTEAHEIWSRTYLIFLLVLTYLITGIFLIVIYGQVIRIILNSNKYKNRRDNTEHYHFLSRNIISQEKFRAIPARTSTSSASTNSSNKHQQPNSTSTARMSIMLPMDKTKCLTNSHSTQHIQVIIMLFIVILLYILLLLPYRLFNLLYIVYNQLFQYNFMNEILFQCLLNTVRLLVFLNCALQPITYLIISSRLKQTVIKFLQSCWYKFYCHCQWPLLRKTEQHYKPDNRAIQAYLSQKYQHTNRLVNQPKKFICRINSPSENNVHMTGYQPLPLLRPTMGFSHIGPKTPYTVIFTNSLRR
jgi:hypothetical protein